MSRRATSPTGLLFASLGLALAAAGCGLGDLPTRQPPSQPPPTAGPSPTPTAVPSPTPTPSPTVRPSPTPLVYTVKPGDSLLSIAKRFKTTGRSIAYWNRATYPSLDPDSSKYDPDRIEVGWKLVLTPGVTIDQALESPPAGSPTPEPTTY
jgi:nucleoid-associated protein YgaU